MRNILSLALLVSVATLVSCKGGMKEFKTLKSGLQYKIVDDKKGDKKAVIGSMISMHVVTKVKDSVLFDSRKMNDNKPIETQVNAPTGVGDIMEVFPELTEGDSVVMQINSDSLFKDPQQQRPPFIKPGDMLVFTVKLEKVQTKEEFEKAKAETSKVQLEADQKQINDYLTKNGLTAQKTESGMYYIITKPGAGPNATAGQEISMNYTGTLLDGTKFDSNEDPAFQHVEPFSFVLGQGMVIRGWDEGIALLNKGAKAKLLIPSPLAYGERSMPASPANAKGIPANSPLIFDVEVKNISEPKTATPAPTK